MTGKLKVLSLSKEIEGLKEKKSYIDVNRVKNGLISEIMTFFYNPKASLCFFVQAKEILSIIIAKSTIPIPAARPLPVSDLAKPLNTSKPRPFPPISGVTICIAKAIITVWLKPITKLGIAKGNFTLLRVCKSDPPKDLETSE